MAVGNVGDALAPVHGWKGRAGRNKAGPIKWPYSTLHCRSGCLDSPLKPPTRTRAPSQGPGHAAPTPTHSTTSLHAPTLNPTHPVDPTCRHNSSCDPQRHRILQAACPPRPPPAHLMSKRLGSSKTSSSLLAAWFSAMMPSPDLGKEQKEKYKKSGDGPGTSLYQRGTTSEVKRT